MRSYLILILRMFLFWWIIFLINRIIFILYFLQKFKSISLSESLATFIHGFALDVSTISYILVLPVILLLMQQFVKINFYRYYLISYTCILLLIISFICVFDLAIYSDWGTKLSYRALHYLQFAKDGSSFTKLSDSVLLLILLLIQLFFGFFLYRKFFPGYSFIFSENGLKSFTAILFNMVLFGLLFLGIRGGWQQIAINESSAYFSKHNVINDAAVNTTWNAVKKALEGSKSLYHNPYIFLSPVEASQLVSSLYTSGNDSTVSILKTAHPNIVLFMLESFTADVIAALGGENGVTPNLDTLIHHALLFDNIYAQGFRTDQGLCGILSGFPAQPNFSIIMQPEKIRQLSFLPARMVVNGYHTSFFYGGESAFANMKAYLLDAGIEKITDKNAFSSAQMNAKWGAHDGYVFQKQASDIINEATPFFSVILSLSSHEPFEVPMETKFPGDDVAAKFKNSCFYTDLSIGAYFEQVKNEKWFENTLFIIVADHGHLQPRNRNPQEPARFHIPLICYGPVLKEEFRGTRNVNLGMQSDLPATILAQLRIPYQEFKWSNNLLNPTRNDFAYYTSDDAFGWITNRGAMLYDFKNDSVQNKGLSAKEENTGKAFLQMLFETYINY